MKRTIVLLMILAVASIATVAQTDDAAISYDLAAESFAEMLDVLDQAIYLVATAAAGGTGQFMRGELQEYAQAVINLLEGPESELFDDENDLAMVPTLGLIPLMDGLRARSGGPAYEELFPDYEYGYSSIVLSFRTAWALVDSALNKASDVAQSMIRPLYTFPWEQELSALYALLVSARGGDRMVFPLGGVRTLSEVFPLREIWVEADESIQEAIDRVPEGGTVYVAVGIYRETLLVNKNVSLVAASHAPNGLPELGRTILEGMLWRASIEITSAAPIDVTITGFIIRDAHAAITAEGACSVLVEDVSFERDDTGLFVNAGASVKATSSVFTENQAAVRVIRGGYCSLKDSLIEDSHPMYSAVDVSCAVLEVVNCEISDTRGKAISVGPGPSSQLHLVNSRLFRNSQALEVASGFCVSDIDTEAGQTSRAYELSIVTGWGNSIPGPDEEDGNLSAFGGPTPFAEPDLAFLTQPKPEEE